MNADPLAFGGRQDRRKIAVDDAVTRQRVPEQDAVGDDFELGHEDRDRSAE